MATCRSNPAEVTISSKRRRACQGSRQDMGMRTDFPFRPRSTSRATARVDPACRRHRALYYSAVGTWGCRSFRLNMLNREAIHPAAADGVWCAWSTRLRVLQ